MNAHIYILTDGINTKIGITTDFKTRMSNYKTHNANIRIVKSYPCDFEEARQIETTIKQVFKNKLASTSKEWFSVSPETVDKYVSVLLEKPIATTLPSMHGVPLTESAYRLKEEIQKLVEHKDMDQRIKAGSKNGEFAELFATAFELGIPEHKLPPDSAVILKDDIGVNTQHCILSDRTIKAVWENRVSMPYDDHVWRFFQLAKLSSGYYVAFCTARASMPYIKAMNAQEMVEAAIEVGWKCTIHNEWSWHSPDKTGLALYQPETPVSTKLRPFEKSFRKWLIEKRKALENERFEPKDVLQKAIEDAVHDNTFPLDIHSYQELCDKYFEPFWGITNDEEDAHFLKPAYEFLIAKWKESGV